jgi:hypothetical protein
MRFRRGERLWFAAMHLVREKGRPDFAAALQSHKETVVMFLRLIDPADAGAGISFRFGHGLQFAFLCCPKRSRASQPNDQPDSLARAVS